MDFQQASSKIWPQSGEENFSEHHAPLNVHQLQAYAVLRGRTSGHLGPLSRAKASNQNETDDYEDRERSIDTRFDALASARGTNIQDQMSREKDVVATHDAKSARVSEVDHVSSGRGLDLQSMTCSDAAVVDSVVPIVVDIKPPKLTTPGASCDLLEASSSSPTTSARSLRLEWVKHRMALSAGRDPPPLSRAVLAQFQQDTAATRLPYSNLPNSESRQPTHLKDNALANKFQLSSHTATSNLAQSINNSTLQDISIVAEETTIPCPSYISSSSIVAMYDGMTNEVDENPSQFGERDYQGPFKSTRAMATDVLEWSHGTQRASKTPPPISTLDRPNGPLYPATPGRDKTLELPKKVTYVEQFDEDGRPQTPYCPDPDAEPRVLRSPIGVNMDFMPFAFSRMNPMVFAQHARNHRIDISDKQVHRVERVSRNDSASDPDNDVEHFTADDVFNAFENPGIGQHAKVEQGFTNLSNGIRRNVKLRDAAVNTIAAATERFNSLAEDINDLRTYIDARNMDNLKSQRDRLHRRQSDIRFRVLENFHKQLDEMCTVTKGAVDMQAAAAHMESQLAELGAHFARQNTEFELQGETLAQAAAWRFFHGDNTTAIRAGISYARATAQSSGSIQNHWVVTSCPPGAVDEYGQSIAPGQTVPVDQIEPGHNFANIDFTQFDAPTSTPEAPARIYTPVESLTSTSLDVTNVPNVTSSPQREASSLSLGSPTGFNGQCTAPLNELSNHDLEWNCVKGCQHINYGENTSCDRCGIDRDPDAVVRDVDANAEQGTSRSGTPRPYTNLQNFADFEIKPLVIRKVNANPHEQISTLPELTSAAEVFDEIDVHLSPINSPRPGYEDNVQPIMFVENRGIDDGQFSSTGISDTYSIGRCSTTSSNATASEAIPLRPNWIAPLLRPGDDVFPDQVIMGAHEPDIMAMYGGRPPRPSVIRKRALEGVHVSRGQGAISNALNIILNAESLPDVFHNSVSPDHLQGNNISQTPNRKQNIGNFEIGSDDDEDDDHMRGSPHLRRNPITKNPTHGTRNLEVSPTPSPRCDAPDCLARLELEAELSNASDCW